MRGAIALAGNDLADKDGYQANIVMMTGAGATTGASRSTANGAVANSGASVFAVELLGQGMSPGALDSMVRENGGLVFSTQTGTDLGDLVTQVGTTVDEQQFSIGFEASTEVGSVANLDLTVGDQNAKAAVVIGSEVVGATSLAPDVTTSAGGISFLQGPLGMILLIGVVLVAAIALAYGVIMIFVREDRLSTALQPYDDALANASADTDDDDDGHGRSGSHRPRAAGRRPHRAGRRAAGHPQPHRGRPRTGEPPVACRRGVVLLRRRRRRGHHAQPGRHRLGDPRAHRRSGGGACSRSPP